VFACDGTRYNLRIKIINAPLPRYSETPKDNSRVLKAEVQEQVGTLKQKQRNKVMHAQNSSPFTDCKKYFLENKFL
jgi:hypothetical protein